MPCLAVFTVKGLEGTIVDREGGILPLLCPLTKVVSVCAALEETVISASLLWAAGTQASLAAMEHNSV